MRLTLRSTRPEDLDALFEIGKDPVAIQMAAFTSGDPTDRGAFDARWDWILTSTATMNFTILEDDRIIGSIASFEMEGDREVTYWLDRSAWGRGIAKWALAELLKRDSVRPIYGRAASDNLASRKVLESAGFVQIGTARAFANARGEEIEEAICRLD